MNSRADRPRSALSEHESKLRLAAAGVPVASERLVRDPERAAAAALDLGLPVAVKLCARGLAHKTERGLVRLGLAEAAQVRRAAAELLSAARPEDGEVRLLVARMVAGRRELIAGATRDPTFGAIVLLGLGGIFAEALSDVAFRLAPLAPADAEDMIDDLRSQALLGPLRGEPAVDRAELARVLLALGRLIEHDPGIASIDVNPLVVASDGRPVAVDASIEVFEP